MIEEPERARSHPVTAASRRACELCGELSRVEAELGRARGQVEELAGRLAQMDEDVARWSTEALALEQQTTHLASLWVATQRLTESLERPQLLEILREIVANLVGVEEIALFEPDIRRGRWGCTVSWGIPRDLAERVPQIERVVSESAGSSRVWLRPDGGCSVDAEPFGGAPSACVPLHVAGQANAVLVLFRLLPQKKHLEVEDVELLESLSPQAGAALELSRLATAGILRR